MVFVHENTCLDVKNSKDTEGQEVIPYKRHNGRGQKWNIILTGKLGAEDNKGFNKQYGFWPGRSFSLWSEQPNHRRLTAHPNQYLYTTTDSARKPTVNEQFYFDLASKMIKTRYSSNRAITMPGGKATYARCMPNMRSRWWDMHTFDGNRLVNVRGLVLDAY